MGMAVVMHHQYSLNASLQTLLLVPVCVKRVENTKDRQTDWSLQHDDMLHESLAHLLVLVKSTWHEHAWRDGNSEGSLIRPSLAE